MTAAHAVASMQCLALLLLSACTSATITAPDGTAVEFSRFATDVGIEVELPDGSRILYTSNPADIAQASLIEALLKALRVAAVAP